MTAADKAAKGARLISEISLLAAPGLIGTNRLRAAAVAQGIHQVANRAEMRLREYDARLTAEKRRGDRHRTRQRDTGKRKERQPSQTERRARSRRER